MIVKNRIEQPPAAIATEAIEPVFFAGVAGALYGCHHFPGLGADRGMAVVLCPAYGYEYERTHRALRRLAVQLARAGHHAFRFDYFGTGDSEGACEQASLAQWRQDVGAAIEQCTRRSRQRHVCLFGMRLGAVLAAQVAPTRAAVTRLILYSPVADGARLLGEWHAEDARFRYKHAVANAGADGEILGYPLTASFDAEVRELSLPAPGATLERVLVVASEDERESAQAVAERFATARLGPDLDLRPDAPLWTAETDKAIVPFKSIQRIVAWLSEA